MAASATVTFASTGSTVFAPVRDASALSCGNAFRTSSLQLAPHTRAKCSSNRLVATRASLSEEQKSAGKKALASFIAAGAALSIAGQALAGNPIDLAKNKASQVVSGAKDAATSNLPSLPKIELPTGGDSSPDVGGPTRKGSRVDGVFAKNASYPPKLAGSGGYAKDPSSKNFGSDKNSLAQNVQKIGVGKTNKEGNVGFGSGKDSLAQNVARRSGNIGSSRTGDEGSNSNSGNNPVATSFEKAGNDAKSTFGQATKKNSASTMTSDQFLNDETSRVDKLTSKPKNVANTIQNKAGNAAKNAKNMVGSATPKAPELPNLNPFDNKGAEGLKGKASDMKDTVASNIPTPDMPKLPNSLPNPVEGVKDLKDKASDITGDAADRASSFFINDNNDKSSTSK